LKKYLGGQIVYTSLDPAKNGVNIREALTIVPVKTLSSWRFIPYAIEIELGSD